MLNALKTTWGRNRRVIDNFLSLSLVQFANYVAPLITLPYLFRVLGPSKFGLVELARAITVYFLMLTDYSFSLSATREISVCRDDPKRVSEIFSSVLVLRLLLVLASAAALTLIVLGLPKLRADGPVYYLSFGSVIGMWLFPVWLFQGLERMRFIAALNVTAKLLVVVCVFIFIRDADDYLYVPLLQSAGTIAVGLAGLILALFGFRVRFRLPSVVMLKHEFLDGWHLFISKMATTLYTTSNVVVLGLFTDNTFVAYYAAADKMVRAVQSLQLPLSQAIFPHIGRLAAQSERAAMTYARKILQLVAVVTLVTSIALLATAPLLARIVLGARSEGAVPVIQILSFLPLLGGLNNVLSIQIMVNFGLKKALARIVTAGGLLNIILAVLLVAPCKHTGVALASLTTEILVVAAMFSALHRSGLHVFAQPSGLRGTGSLDDR